MYWMYELLGTDSRKMHFTNLDTTWVIRNLLWYLLVAMEGQIHSIALPSEINVCK